jgi:Protein of unknown function DUF262
VIPQRKFIGSAYNRLIHGVLMPIPDMRPLAEGERYLGEFILPPFQRPPVWTEQQKVRLIESLYMGLPIGSIVWNQTALPDPCDRWLLDGQQRMTAILEYVAGGFAVAGWRYPNLSVHERAQFERLTLPFIETMITDVDLCREVYERLAYGGTEHVM